MSTVEKLSILVCHSGNKLVASRMLTLPQSSNQSIEFDDFQNQMSKVLPIDAQ